MDLFILFIGLILGAAAGLFIYINFFAEPDLRKQRNLFNDFAAAKRKVINNSQKGYDELLHKAKLEYEAKKTAYEEQIASLSQKVTDAWADHSQQLKNISKQNQRIIEEECSKRNVALSEIQKDYDTKVKDLNDQFEHFKNGIAWEQKELQDKIKKEEAKYNEIVEQFKRQEKIRQDKDFYRIVLTDSQKEDVKKLKTIAAELHDPSVLYKLIYKTYYERPFNEMVGRVVTGRGDTGIYKITNLENGRVYIGQTRQAFKERWRTHVKRGLRAEPTTNNKLYAAMWEDNLENFTFEVLSECTAAELNEKEKEYIQLFQGDTWGYNSTSGNS